MIDPPSAEPSAASRAYTSIRDGIIRGDLAGGTMLSENELAAALALSRTPVRSALTRLQDEGWLTIFPKRGALVNALTEHDIEQVVEARIALEAASVAAAAPAARIALAESMRSSIAEQRDALATRDIDRFIELTLRFHCAFVELGANRFLLDTARRLLDRQRQIMHAQSERMFARTDDIAAEHTELLERLADDDVVGFAGVLRRHMTDTHGQ